MKTAVSVVIALVVAVIGGSGCASPAPSAQVATAVTVNGSHPLGVEVEGFYNDLAPYGRWFWLAPYGWVWTPSSVPYGWRPYTVGRWVWTDDGWTWDSDYPWGRACFHYGRWAYTPDYGWLWVPGTVWSPAWVAWNYGADWYGWAPLPPLMGWGTAPDWDAIIPAHCWVFIDHDDFLRRHLRDYCLPEARNVTLLQLTRNHTRFELHDHRVINRSLPVEDVEKALGHPVHRYRIQEFHSLAEAHRFHAGRDQLAIVRPRFEERHAEHQPPASIAPEAEEHHERAVRPPGAEEHRMRNLSHQQAVERQRFYHSQEGQREALQRYHNREWKHPPAGVSHPGLFERQMNENRALNEQMERENHLLQRRQEEEFHAVSPRGRLTTRENSEGTEREEGERGAGRRR